LHFIAVKFNENTSFQAFFEVARPLNNRSKSGYDVFVVRNRESGRIEEFEEKHQKLYETTIGVHPMGSVLTPEAEQDHKALMKGMPEGPRKLTHKKNSLFDGAGYVTRNGNTIDSDKIERGRVDKGQIRYSFNNGFLKLEVGKRPSASQVAKLRQLIGRASSVDLDVYSDSHKDFEHYKKDRLYQVIAAISWFFDTNRLPPFQGLAPLRTDVERLDQG
jgi:hypothetical protein